MIIELKFLEVFRERFGELDLFGPNFIVRQIFDSLFGRILSKKLAKFTSGSISVKQDNSSKWSDYRKGVEKTLRVIDEGNLPVFLRVEVGDSVTHGCVADLANRGRHRASQRLVVPLADYRAVLADVVPSTQCTRFIADRSGFTGSMR